MLVLFGVGNKAVDGAVVDRLCDVVDGGVEVVCSTVSVEAAADFCDAGDD